MGFIAAIVTCLTKSLDFRGRAPRLEFWGFVVFWVAAAVVSVLAMKPAHAAWSAAALASPLLAVPLALSVPLAAVAVRRLHDIGLSGWWLVTAAAPVPVLDVLIVGAQVVCFARPGTVGANRYGPDPRRS